MELHDKKRYLTKTEVLERGWTEMAMEKLLGEPDRMRLNHLYKNTKSIKLYLENRVIEREKSEDYQNYIRRVNQLYESRRRKRKRS